MPDDGSRRYVTEYSSLIRWEVSASQSESFFEILKLFSKSESFKYFVT
jgi:hypothetical protein